MDIIGLDDMSDPEAIFSHIDWKPGLVDVSELCKNFDLPQVNVLKYFNNVDLSMHGPITGVFFLIPALQCLVHVKWVCAMSIFLDHCVSNVGGSAMNIDATENFHYKNLITSTRL